KSFFGSFADLFIPSTVLQSFYDNPSQFTKIITANFTIDQVLFFIGIILFVLAVVFGAYLLKNKKFIFKLYFASFALVVLYIPLAFLAAIIESGLSITTLESVHHILTPITIWSSLLLGISLYVLYEEKRKLAIIMTSLIVLIISLLSMQQILLTVNNKSYKLKNFYSSVLLSVPKINNPYVFYFSSVTPPVLNPFVVGDSAIHQSSYLAGFYHTNYKNIILADNFSDALHKLKENNIPLNRFNYFYTNQQQTKNITKDFISFVNGSSSYAIPLIDLTSSNIDKPSFYPYELHFSLQAEPDFSSISINDKNTRYNPYYDLLFRNAQEKSTYTVFSPNAPSSLENSADKSLDNNLNTLWIPKQWEKNGDSLVIDMRAQKSISAVAFETSGAFPWKQRSPTEYTIFTSNDGFSWQQIVHESKNTPLMSGEYLFHSFNPTQARYVKIVITKTYGNFPPAVDEIEIFDNLFSGFNFATYAQVAQNPLQYLPSLDMLQQVYEVLYKNNLSFSIDEKIDADTIWKDERKLLVKLQQNSQNYIVPFPADGYTLKAV
ncbi:MAG TPA: discoidin domain-containing protein, partial [Patescibacteria group bacterium]